MRRIAPVLLFLQMVVLGACTSIDCPLNNTVVCKYVLDGPVVSLTDTLNVLTHRVGRPDTLLLNRLVQASDFTIPMSHTQDVDELYFTLTNSSRVNVTDTVRIGKENHPHFESLECPPSFIHTLSSVEHTTHAIDSIIITKSIVNYDTTGGNLRIYFKSGH